MTKKQLAQDVDELGKLRDRIHALKADESALTETVRDQLRALKTKAKVARGERYEAELTRADRVVIDDLAALRRAAGKKFLRCVKADIAGARRELGDTAVGRLGSTRPGWQLRVYKIDPGKAPRRSPGAGGKKAG